MAANAQVTTADAAVGFLRELLAAVEDDAATALITTAQEQLTAAVICPQRATMACTSCATYHTIQWPYATPRVLGLLVPCIILSPWFFLIAPVPALLVP